MKVKGVVKGLRNLEEKSFSPSPALELEGDTLALEVLLEAISNLRSDNLLLLLLVLEVVTTGKVEVDTQSLYGPTSMGNPFK